MAPDAPDPRFIRDVGTLEPWVYRFAGARTRDRGAPCPRYTRTLFFVWGPGEPEFPAYPGWVPCTWDAGKTRAPRSQIYP